MPKQKEDKKREQRITDWIIVDAYDEGERALGWYYYLEEKIAFPFTGECIEKRGISPLQEGEHVEVIGMCDEDDCAHEIFVQIKWQEHEMGIPLAQIRALKIDTETKEAIADWHYWVAMGYSF